MKRHPKQGTGSNHMILRSLLIKIFERFERPGNLLNLVKDQQGLPGDDFESD